MENHFVNGCNFLFPPVDDYSTPLLSGQNKQAAAEQPARRGMQLGARGGQNKAEMDKLTDMLRNEVPLSMPDVVKAASTVATVGSSVAMQKCVALSILNILSSF